MTDKAFVVSGTGITVIFGPNGAEGFGGSGAADAAGAGVEDGVAGIAGMRIAEIEAFDDSGVTAAGVFVGGGDVIGAARIETEIFGTGGGGAATDDAATGLAGAA